ncbi:hypothetical protein H310_08967 [Aphanomyces invadans]|uniref:HECT domain-containing protein n=1 Tax=Aphanomyces invadans TaxID=157072 RepID=A0A024TW78_9STRA|nr:hypothetical protein H310_08967 [Aphanomyces invadans]ETV98249.1 hypothetical protein H310_08967 [Aphanomyces invadans]|eukprot:XP_008873124.1 hypothetical protein H310_08967 [Aphanomyces invadans]
MGAARSHSGFGSALGLFERADREASSHVGISSAALEALANDQNASVKLVDALQTMTHNLAMMEASSEGGLGLLMGRPKITTKKDPNLVTVLGTILSNKTKFELQPRLLACQSLNYLIKMDLRMSDGKKAQDCMTMYLGVMDEIASKHDERAGRDDSPATLSMEKHLAEEATNGLEVSCHLHPFAFRELCQPVPLAKLLRFLLFANALHLNVLLTSLSLLQKVCQKVHFHMKPPPPAATLQKAHHHSNDKPTASPTVLSTILGALETYIGHSNPRVQIGAIKCMTILYHRTPLHDHLSTSCIRQLLHIMVAPSTEDSYDASRASVALLTELVDESTTVFTTLLDPDVVRTLMQQLPPMLQTEAVATSTLRFLSKVTARIGHQASGVAKTSLILHRLLVAFIKANDVSTVSALLKDGANLHTTSPSSPFLVAVTDSCVEMVRLLIRKGAHVSVEALHAAALAERCDIVSLLLQHGASPHAANEHGETLAQVLAKHPPSHPITKLLAMHNRARFHLLSVDHDRGEADSPHHHHHTSRHPDHTTASTDGATSSRVQSPPGDVHARGEVLLSDFAREWNDMDTEEDDESEHFDDEEMHSDDDEDEYHGMYHDESQDDEEDDGDDEGNDEEDDEIPMLVDPDDGEDDDDSKHGDADDGLPLVDIRREDAVAFTHALFTSLVHAVPSIDNKQVTNAVLSTMANVLIYPIELADGDINVLLEVIHGLLMESNDSTMEGEHGAPDTDLNVYAMVLALRLLEALSSVNSGTAVVCQMERQGILDRLRSFAAQTHTSPVDATVASLVIEWLNTGTSLSADMPMDLNPIVGQLNALCDALPKSPSTCDTAVGPDVLDDLLTCIDAGITTYELTKSNVVPTLLHALSLQEIPWNPKLQALVRHLHQVVGLHESLPTVTYAMAKGKEFYPLTRQLRCRMRLVPSHEQVAPVPPRSIHASPLTLFSSFERTVFRCAPISDPKWLMYAWSLVGQPIWKPVDGKWVEAAVCGFDASTGCHLIHFRDEFVEEVLQEEAYRLVKTPLRVFSSVSMDLSLFGSTSALKRRTPDDHSNSPVRRSKRVKRRSSDDDASSRHEDAAAAAPSDGRSPPSDKRSRERRLMDVLKLQDSTTPGEGDKVWVSNGSSICVCGTYVRKTTSQQVEVEVSFGSQVNVPLVVEETNLVPFQAKARPGSASSKDFQGRGGGGRPVLEHLRRLLARSRHDHIHADQNAPAVAGIGGSSETASAASGTPKRKGKQKAVKAPSPPTIQCENQQFTVMAPPIVRVLLGYGDYSDKSEDQLHWLTTDGDHLNDKAIPVAQWLFHVFGAGQKPKVKPETLDVPSLQHVSWSLATFGAFCKEIKLGLMSSEVWIMFSSHSTTETDQDVLTWTQFSAWLVAICRDARHMRCLWQYLEHLGFKTSAFLSTPTAPTQLAEFAPDDNLFYCLHKIHPTRSLGLVPWKCVFNVFCDFSVRWNNDDATKPATLSEPLNDVVMADDGETSWGPPVFTQSVGLLRVLHEQFSAELGKDAWLNPRLSRKLRMQLQDVLSVTSGTYPAWCDELVQQSKFFFPLEMRYTLFRTTAFGFSRSLHWFRDHLDHDSTNDELSISPLPKERAKVDRVDIIKSADAVMKVHAKRKAILDIVFVGERGYGSGVTAAFYSAVANALQCNKPLRIWVNGHEDSSGDVIRHPNGLFPLPVLDATDVLKDRFRLMGRLAGKALQDERLLPLPLSSQFLRLVLGEPIAVDDVATIFLEPGRILFSLYKASKALESGQRDVMIEKMRADEWLATVDLNFVDPITQAELGTLSVEIAIASYVWLVDVNGSAKAVTVDNLHSYVELVLRSWLDRGVAAQVEAFQEGLSEVVALKKLKLLFVDELQLTLCGTVDVDWTKESLRQTIKLAHGYTSSSEPIEHFIDVLVDMTTAQRRAFLLYATGCPHLPPGGVGFEKLKPPFEVVRRVSPDNQPVDVTLPFARTCTNTLHLPAYSSKAILAKQLEYAVLNSKGVIDRD